MSNFCALWSPFSSLPSLRLRMKLIRNVPFHRDAKTRTSRL